MGIEKELASKGRKHFTSKENELIMVLRKGNLRFKGKKNELGRGKAEGWK